MGLRSMGGGAGGKLGVHSRGVSFLGEVGLGSLWRPEERRGSRKGVLQG